MSLFNKKFVNKQIAITPTPDAARVATFREWAADIKSGKIATHSEVSLHGPFVQKILVEALGYSGPIGNEAYSVTQEKGITRGSVDVAIGRFEHGEGQILAPFELKGADTKNLDAIMSGRAKTPVDQAWEYATNNVGTKWVLVSNYLEIRLYSYGEGRQVYETFDLANLHEPAEYARVQLLLSAENLLSGKTLELLEESRRENKDITNRLYADYTALRSDLIEEVGKAKPGLPPLLAIRAGQKILDRILFVAFAEDTISNGKRLLPNRSIENAYNHTNIYSPTPVWETFRSLFHAIDTGLPTSLNIPRYNGGLFAPDEVINSIAISDEVCEGFKRLAEYDFASEISVTVLGHIFEQSIADVEQLQAEARGETVEVKRATGTSGRRKRDGVVYTPDYIARFIVEQTLGTHCREIFDALLVEHAKAGATANDKEIPWKKKNGVSEKAFWQAYRDRTSKLRIVDPACGSGVFLVMAFDWLKDELMRCNSALEKLGEGALFEPDSEILTHNLFGVDVNEESVEIAKLSLWIKTARHGKVLDSLDYNFRVGDSLIEDSSYAYRSHGFVWKEAFKDIFAEGGFDIVLGNPPYVRMELLKELKPYLAKRFEVVSDRADLYAYFFERGINLLKIGGRLGYISSSTFFKTGSGEPLRNFLRSNAKFESVVDFGDTQIFGGVTTYPAILTMSAGAPQKDHRFNFWNVDRIPDGSFSEAFEKKRQAYPQQALASSSWSLENDKLREIRTKIRSKKPTLKEMYGSPFAGIKTGYNKAFIISTAQKQAICADATALALLKPIAFGNEVQPWRIERDGKWIIYVPKGKIKIDDFPSVKQWLGQYKERLEERAANQKWFELQQAQDAFAPTFGGTKVVYRDIADRPTFSVDTGTYIDMTCFCLQKAGYYEAGLLNSKLMWFTLTSETTIASGGFFRMKSQYIEPLPIPPATNAQKAELAALAEAAQTAAEARYALQQEITRRIPDLATGTATKLTERLKTWWDLPDFAAFQAEVKKALKSDIPLKDRNDWENWISDNRTKIHTLTAEISRIESEINDKVYSLFDLTTEEIEMLEANI